MNFIHLRIHTEYSLIDSTVRVDELIKTAVKNNMPALAITDHMNLFAAVKFYQEALKAGIKPILGVDVLIENTLDFEKPFHLTLLCQNMTGYKNLTRLISRAYTEGVRGMPQLCYSWFEGFTEGLIALSGGKLGDAGQALLSHHAAQARTLLLNWKRLFPQRFYIELQRTQRHHEEEYNQAALLLAEKLSLPVIASNDIRFLEANDFEAHEARVCIHAGWVLQDPRRPHLYTAEQYFKNATEMALLFVDVPSALENTVEIAKRCSLELPLGKVFLPQFVTPDGLSTEDFLIQQARIGLEQRLKSQALLSANDQEKKQTYLERLNIELDVINKIGFAGYFLIVADFIQWSKRQGIPVGPGRGSGAGSLVAFSLSITDIDPLPYGLLFERFLNPERVSMPDFDIDFCMDGRDRVIEYVTEHYGRNRVSQIITFGTMAAKAVVRDVGRVLAHPYGFVDKLAKLIPFELGITLEKALEQEPLLKARYKEEEEVKTLIDLALKLEGLTRNAGKHAGGVVVAPSDLSDFSPLYCEQGGQHYVTQFDKNDVETIGLVKFDFLGLRTLTIINNAVITINKQRFKTGESLLDITQLPMDDAATFTLLKACQTTAVFQLESRGMKDLIRRLQPDCFEDIVALVALFRPGPLGSGMIDDFINRKQGLAQASYLHPSLESILKQTYGIILYQEQVMQVAQVLAGYTLGSADLLRRAMGKKKPEEMAKQREVFTQGAIKNGVPEKSAKQIFDLMEKFAEYGFNKSHSAAYALISYQTAWLKAHYPAEFMAAVLSSDMDNTDKVVLFLQECKNMHLTLLPPSLNESDHHFSVVAPLTIRYGLGAIKGVGANAIETILTSRQEKNFSSLFDFCKRVDAFKVNRRVLEALIRSGALDDIEHNRASLIASIDKALHTAEQFHRNQQQGQADLFGLHIEDACPHEDLIPTPPWSDQQRLQGEKETLGHYLSGHPLSPYKAEIQQLTTFSPQKTNEKETQAVFVGLVTATRSKLTRKNDKMGFATLDNGDTQCEVLFFPEVYNKYQSLLFVDAILVVEGLAGIDDFTQGHKIICQRALTLEQARQQFGRSLRIKLHDQQFLKENAETLKGIIKPHTGGSFPLQFEYYKDKVKVKIDLDNRWRVTPRDSLLKELEDLLGKGSVEVCYVG